MLSIRPVWLSCLVVFGTVAVSTVQAQESQEDLQAKLENAVAAGEEYLQQENWEEAAKAFSEVIKINSNSPAGYIGRGDAFRGMKEYERALKDYTDANAKSYQGPPPRLQYGRGKLYLDLGQVQLAAADLQAAYASNPENPQFIFALGKVYALAGAGAQAEKLLDEYIAIDDTLAEPYALRGRAYAAQQKFELALADLNTAIGIDPDDADTYFTLGVINYQQKEYARAIEAISKSIEIFEPEEGQPQVPMQAYLTKAAIHEDAAKAAENPDEVTKQLEASIATCNELLEILPETQAGVVARAAALFRRGIAERFLGRFADAVRSISEAINVNPELGEAYFRRGICWLELNEADLALRDFETAQNIEYDKPRYYLWEGIALAKQEKYYEAIESYSEAIALSNRYVDAYLNRAHAWMKLEEYDKAVGDFNKCIGLEPTNAHHYFKRGVAYAMSQKHDEAIRSFVNAINFDPQLIDSYDWVAGEFDRTGQGSLAGEYRTKAKELRGE